MENNETLTVISMILEGTTILVSATHLYTDFLKKRHDNHQKIESKKHKYFRKYILPSIIIICFILFILEIHNIKSYNLIIQDRKALLWGILMTLEVSVVAIIFGTILGFLTALLLTRKKHNYFLTFINSSVTAIIYILLAMPVLVLLFIAHYSGLIESVFLTSSIALSINIFPFVTKILTASINNISQEQIDAAIAFGYSDWKITRYFRIAYVVKNSLQSLLVEYYTTIKLSSLAGYIGLVETFHVSQDIIKDTQDPISGYVILSICYFILVSLLAIPADYLEYRWKNTLK